ncbi:MAG: methyltransferase domain-containing protein, partial [bacterium]
MLELGAGTGLLTRALAKMSAEVVASDLALGMLRFGRERNGLELAVVADAERLPFRDASFDVVVAKNALSYCVHKDRALAEARRVLVPGGRLLLIDMNYVLYLPYHLLALKEWRKARLWTSQLLQSTPWGWRRRVTAAGFAIESLSALNWIPHRFGRAAVTALLPLDALLSRIPLLRWCAMRLALS